MKGVGYMNKAIGIIYLVLFALIIVYIATLKVPEWKAEKQLPGEIDRISAEAAEICEKHGIKKYEISIEQVKILEDYHHSYYLVVTSPETPSYSRIFDLLNELDELEFNLNLKDDPYLLLSKSVFANEAYNIYSGHLEKGIYQVYPPTTAKPTTTVPETTKKSSGYFKSHAPKTTEDDPYYARDYLYPEDFYYDYYDDFDDYEDAEDYFDEMS